MVEKLVHARQQLLSVCAQEKAASPLRASRANFESHVQAQAQTSRQKRPHEGDVAGVAVAEVVQLRQALCTRGVKECGRAQLLRLAIVEHKDVEHAPCRSDRPHGDAAPP